MSLADVSRAWTRAAVGTTVLAAVTGLVVVVATATLPAADPVAVQPGPGFAGWEPAPTDASGTGLLATGLVRFDALWYLAIAADGYPTTESVPQAAAFFPGYPAAVAVAAVPLGGRLVPAALLVSLLATLVAVTGLHRLAELVGGDDLGRGTVMATVAFPTAFFLLAPYAESLLLACATWALVHAARGRPAAAALCALAATLVRPVGVLLVVPLLLGVVRGGSDVTGVPALRGRGGTVGARATAALLPSLGVAAGGVALLVWGQLAWGDPLAVASAQAGWQRTLMLPPVTLWHAVRFGLRALVDGSTPYHLLDLVVLGLTGWGLVALTRRREWPLVAHTVVNLLLWLAQPFPGRPLMSTPRFALAVPGVLIGLGLAARGRVGGWVLPAVGVALLTLHLALYTRWLHVF